ncbi:ABC transporter ATP-binding protein [Nakamurella flava]|uniref:ABC-type quaternary amine transporter n=1 Tax=Nakamurella flava TaxID=2576308 RepID=A0A4U6QAN9_9ACTN|nr:ABC transporter ATP-binding protein [Nakamurella flava]TKV57023.1 ABC transporter ATP-binding protein [Nakamurella flava]
MKIALEHLSLTYGTNTVVKDLDLQIADGESLVLLGQSGCGKTSTMRCIAGLEQPSGGRITIGDTVVHDSERRVTVAPYKRNVGMVFQSYAVWPHRTVFENVGFSLKMKKVPKDEAAVRIRKALAIVGLSDFESRGASQLSGGQMQRVALARSLVMQPSVLLLDEPLSNLDARLRERLRIELREIQLEQNLTTVYVTHDQIEAFALADRIALMQHGRIVQIGTPQEIYAAPTTKSIADFLGVGNIFPCTVENEGGRQVAKLSGYPVAIPVAEVPEIEGPTVLCLRSEDLHVTPAGPDDVSTPGAWRGHVDVASFQGATVRYRITLEDGPVLEAIAMPRAGDWLRTGDTAMVRIAPNAAQVLRDDTASPVLPARKPVAVAA